MATDGTETQKGTPQPPKAGQSSTAPAQRTLEQTPKTYTESEVQQFISNKLAEAGRERKDAFTRQLETIQTENKSLKERIEAAERQKDEADLEEARSDPERLNLLQLRKRLRDDRVALDRERQSHEAEKVQWAEDITLAKETKKEIEIWQIGERYGADPSILKELGLDSLEAIEKIAKTIGTKKAGGQTQASPKPDSGMTIGGKESLGALAPKDRAREADIRLRTK